MERLSSLPPNLLLGVLLFAVMVVLVLHEWRNGKYEGGRKTRNDWKMFGLSAAGIALVERPLLIAIVYGACRFALPGHDGALAHLEEGTLALTLSVIAYIAIDELVHGAMHRFAHRRPPKGRLLAKVHAFYREAHRPHHLLGDDERGEISATHAVVAGWGWLLFLPNYWLGAVALYFGLLETWFLGNLIKNLWGLHVHANWSYDLWLLNHPNRFVRRGFYWLCHVFTFPNQHHQHHSRSKNSAKNLQNMLALYDWLLWGTLVIETERPRVYGWKQKAADRSPLRRYFRRPLKTAPRR